MKPIKFKYLSYTHSFHTLEELEEDFTEVESPLPYKNLPDGEYLIRGDKKEHRKQYWKLQDHWFLVADVKKDNGHSGVDSCSYHLFPSLPTKEWETIQKAGYRRLNKVWQRHLMGYQQWLRVREIRREINLSFKSFREKYS